MYLRRKHSLLIEFYKPRAYTEIKIIRLSEAFDMINLTIS